jgi:hypothetical protein
MAIGIIAVPAAYIAGAFTPAIGRKIKALFVKEANVVKSDVKAGVTKVEADIKAKV